MESISIILSHFREDLPHFCFLFMNLSFEGCSFMPRPRKYADMVIKSFSLERQMYERLRQALAIQGKSISEEVNELLRKRLAELEGAEISTKDSLNYEALKREHVKLAEDVNRLIRLLQREGLYDQLMGIVAELGLNTELKQRKRSHRQTHAKMERRQKSPPHIRNPYRNIKTEKAIEKNSKK
jgi:hypothetical protein